MAPQNSLEGNKQHLLKTTFLVLQKMQPNYPKKADFFNHFMAQLLYQSKEAHPGIQLAV